MSLSEQGCAHIRSPSPSGTGTATLTNSANDTDDDWLLTTSLPLGAVDVLVDSDSPRPICNPTTRDTIPNVTFQGDAVADDPTQVEYAQEYDARHYADGKDN